MEWARAIGRENGFIVVIVKSDNGGKGSKKRKGRKIFLILGCEKSGKYRKFKNALSHKVSGTKKCECPFRLRGRLLKNGGWKVNVMCGTHNHQVIKTVMGPAYAGRLTDEAKSLIDEMTKNMEKPRDILMALKDHGAEVNARTIRQIYNARQAFRSAQKCIKMEPEM